MIFGSLMMLALTQTNAPSAAASEAQASSDIVVIGRRARAVRWDWRVDRAGRLTKCQVTRSSGDGEIDRMGCEATRQCAARGIRRARPMRECVIPVRDGLIEALAEARAEERARLEDGQD